MRTFKISAFHKDIIIFSYFSVSLKLGSGFAHLVVIGHIHRILALLVRLNVSVAILKVSTILFNVFTLLWLMAS